MCILYSFVYRRWKSLESVSAACNTAPADIHSGKNKVLPRHSLKTWLVGLFNGNGLKASNLSLKKDGVLNEYNNLQLEKESIV